MRGGGGNCSGKTAPKLAAVVARAQRFGVENSSGTVQLSHD